MQQVESYIVHCPTLEQAKQLIAKTNSPYDLVEKRQAYGPNTCYKVTNGAIINFGSIQFYQKNGLPIYSLKEYLELSETQLSEIKTIPTGIYIHCDTKAQWGKLQHALHRDGYRYVDYLDKLTKDNYIITSEPNRVYWGHLHDLKDKEIFEFFDLLVEDNLSEASSKSTDDYLSSLTQENIANILIECYNIDEEFTFQYYPRQENSVSKIEITTLQNSYHVTLRDFRISIQGKDLQNSTANPSYRQCMYLKHGEKYLDDYFSIACRLKSYEDSVKAAEFVAQEARDALQKVKDDIERRKEELILAVNQHPMHLQ